MLTGCRARPQHNPKSPTQLANGIVDRVLKKLKELGRVRSDFVRSQGRRAAVWTLTRTRDALIGRGGEVEAVLTSLQLHGAAVIWGGPGEGKTSVAMEAAARLREHEPDLSAFELDMRGVRSPVLASWHYFCGIGNLHVVRLLVRLLLLTTPGPPACLRASLTRQVLNLAQASRLCKALPAMTPASACWQAWPSVSTMQQRCWPLSTCVGKCAATQLV